MRLSERDLQAVRRKEGTRRQEERGRARLQPPPRHRGHESQLHLRGRDAGLAGAAVTQVNILAGSLNANLTFGFAIYYSGAFFLFPLVSPCTVGVPGALALWPLVSPCTVGVPGV